MRGRRKKEAYDDEYYDDGRQKYDDDYDDQDSYQDDSDDEYEYDESGEIVLDEDDDYGVNLQSRKKAGRYRIISIIFLLLVIGASAMVFMYKKQVVETNQNKCWSYQSLIEGKVKQYVRENGLSANPAYIEDVPGISGIKFECPDGGGFTWDPVNGIYYCSEHGHYPESFVTPESVVTSSQTTAVQNSSSK